MKLVAKLRQSGDRHFVFFQITDLTEEDRAVLKHFGAPQIDFLRTEDWQDLPLWDGEWGIATFGSAAEARAHVQTVGREFVERVRELYSRWAHEKESGTSFEFIP